MKNTTNKTNEIFKNLKEMKQILSDMRKETEKIQEAFKVV